MSNTSFLTQDPNHPVAGGYVQPSAGVTAALVCLSDTSGNAVKTTGTASNVGYLGVAQYRDAAVTVQNSATAAAPTAGTAVATITPATAGLYEITGTVGISGTTVVATDSHNFNLKQGATTKLTNIPYPLTGTTGSTFVGSFGPLILNLDGSTAVTVNAVSSATASSVYAASVVARLIG